MAYLFKIEGKAVFPNEETLLIEPFKSIWERDTSKNKVYALEDFAYIEFVTSLLKTNPYRGYADSVKREVVEKDVITRKDWYEDDLIFKGIEKVKEFQIQASPNYSLYMSAIKAKDKLEEFLNNFDIDERNIKTGVPIFKPKDITSALLDIEKVTASLTGLKKKVEEDLFEETKIEGQKEISPFADPESLNKIIK